MTYEVKIYKKSRKNIERMPENIKMKMTILVDDLIENGPILKDWANFSKLDENDYHCHLSYHWAACWRCEKNQS